jgi:Domain of unknown function (DUF1905)/Bacteriocin-protection, YdeI or OmpD-Associated
MPKSLKKSFTALLEPDGTALKWTIARVPFKAADVWPERRGNRVRGEIFSSNSKDGGFPFRTSLFPDRRGNGQVLLVNKKMQKGAHALPGDKVRIIIEPDLEERKAIMPPELAKALKGAPGLRKWFDSLGDYTRRMFCALVDNLKAPEARVRMAEKFAEQLLQAWEGETDTPPILKAAFVRQPLAEAGWLAMTPTQRRGHLLGIFYYESADARERRAAKAVDEALKFARRKLSASK